MFKNIPDGGVPIYQDEASLPLSASPGDQAATQDGKFFVWDIDIDGWNEIGNGSGPGTGDISNGGNDFGEPIVIGTEDDYEMSFITSNETRLIITEDGHVGIGTGSPDTEKLSVFHTIPSISGNFTGISSGVVVQGVTSGTGFQQALFAELRADHDTGNLSLLRNYITSEMSGDGTVTEMYGARTIARVFDYDAGGGDTSSGTVNKAFGLESYVANVATGGAIIREATGVYISRAEAIGTDGSNAHIAIGLKIEEIVASGGLTNEAYSIYSATEAPAFFEGDVWLRDMKTLRFYDNDNTYYTGLRASTDTTETKVYVLPTAPGDDDDVLTLVNASTGEMQWLPSGGGGSGDILNGGNSFGADMTIGTNDNNALIFETNGSEKARIRSTGALLVGDNGSNLESLSFGVRNFETADTNDPYMEVQGFFSYYGSTSTSKTGTSMNYIVRPGDASHTYSGEHTGMTSEAVMGTDGLVTSLYGQMNRVININSTGIIGTAKAEIVRVLSNSTGIIRNAYGIEIATIEAQGTDSANHKAYGISIAAEGNLLLAEGSSGTNQAYGIFIGNGISAATEAYAIKSESLVPSRFDGNMELTDGLQLLTTDSQPTCEAATRGKLWVVQGGTGVADLCQVCLKDASDAYVWSTV